LFLAAATCRGKKKLDALALVPRDVGPFRGVTKLFESDIILMPATYFTGVTY